MGLHIHHARRQLRRDCDDLIGWSVALRAAQPDGARFIEAWVPLASRLHRRAEVIDRRTGEDVATRAVAETCDAVLADMGFAPLPPEAYGCPAPRRRNGRRERSLAA